MEKIPQQEPDFESNEKLELKQFAPFEADLQAKRVNEYYVIAASKDLPLGLLEKAISGMEVVARGQTESQDGSGDTYEIITTRGNLPEGWSDIKHQYGAIALERTWGIKKMSEKVKNAIENPESIKNLPLSELAELLNEAECRDSGYHPLKKIIGSIMNERFPRSQGWESYMNKTGTYFDPWDKRNGDKRAQIHCSVTGDYEEGLNFYWSAFEKN